MFAVELSAEHAGETLECSHESRPHSSSGLENQLHKACTLHFTDSLLVLASLAAFVF